MIERGARLEIASIAAGGDGVGRTEGMVVFVPRTAPGDVARVRIARAKRFARGELLSLDEPSPSRVDPPCPHYSIDRCGGCQLQHLSYHGQLAAKSVIIGDPASDKSEALFATSPTPWWSRANRRGGTGAS